MTDADGAASAGNGQAETVVPATVEQSLAPVIADLPEPKQKEIVRTFEQQFMAIVRGGIAPQIDPETAKILAGTIQKDNDNKFRYLTQKQADSATHQAREHALATAQHNDLMKPVVWSVIAVTGLTVVSALAFIATGHEAIGSSLLTGVLGALLGYLGGLGTAGRFGSRS